MPRRGRRLPFDPSLAVKYHRVATSLLKSANDLNDIAEEGASYGNALGIVGVHACIAYVDALCIRYGGFKSGEGDHLRAVDALQEALGTRAEPGLLKLTRRIIAQKDQVSYQGTYYTLADAQRILDDLLALSSMAEKLLS